MENGRKNRILFTVPGEPRGKQRARTGKGFAYTPEQTVNYEALVKMAFEQSKPEGFIPIEGQAIMHINAFYPIPKSTSKKKTADMLQGKIRPTKKPDVDNIAKIIADALNTIAYKDDAQIIEVHVYKLYSQNPRVEVTIEEGGEDANGFKISG